MKARIARRLLTCLFVLPWLGGCGLRQHPLPQPALQPASVIEVPQPVYQPLPIALTAPIPAPVPPTPHCTYLGMPAVCVLDGLLWIEKLQGALQSANIDRTTSGAVTTGKP